MAYCSRKRKEQSMRVTSWIMASALAAASLGGCVKLQAPDKPIEINLNVNVRQEVIVRLEQEVRELIEKNPGIF